MRQCSGMTPEVDAGRERVEGLPMALRDLLRKILDAEARVPPIRPESPGESLADPFTNPHGGGIDAVWGTEARRVREESDELADDEKP